MAKSHWYTIKLKGKSVEYLLKPRVGRRTVSIVMNDGRVEVWVPGDMSLDFYREEADDFLKKHANWVLARLEQTPNENVYTVELNGESITYQLKPHRNRRKIEIFLTENGLEARVPWSRSPQDYRAEIEACLKAEADRILAKLKAEVLKPKQYVDGIKFPYRGSEAILRLGKETTQVTLQGGQTEIWLKERGEAPQEKIQRALYECLKMQMKAVLQDCLPRVTARAQRLPTKWELSNAQRRLGCCTSTGVIRLAWRLIALSDKEIEYVIAHELAHLIEFNHSPAFWREVARIMPDWKSCKQMIRSHSIRLY